MKIENLRKKDLSALKKDLTLFYREKFVLLLEKTSGAEFVKNHLLKRVRKKIARVLTLIVQLEKKKT